MKKIFALFLIALTLSGCMFSQAEENIFVMPCTQPCWEGIIPGISTELDVKAILAHIPYIDEAKTIWINNWDKFNSVVRSGFIDSKKQEVEIYINNKNLVEAIYLDGGYELSLDSIIQKLGDPHEIIIGSAYDTHAIFGDVIDNQVNIIFRDKSIIVSLPVNHDINIQPNSKIERVIFCESSAFDKLIEDYVNSYNYLISHNRIWAWKGYGIFTEEGEIK